MKSRSRFSFPCSKQWPFLIVLAIWSCITGCVVGPEYQKPTASILPPGLHWKLAEPDDAVIRPDWWQLFHDPKLNELEAQATTANPGLKAAIAHVDASRAAARITDSRFFPQLSFDPSVVNFQTQLNHVPSELSATAYTIPLDLNYEVDLWGKIRHSLESNQAEAGASLANYYSVLLTLHGDVAVDYFALRQLDDQNAIWRQITALNQKELQIINDRFHAGLVPKIQVQQVRETLARTETAAAESQRQRDDLQNALALLCGHVAPDFEIVPGALRAALPSIPVGLPSSLLERRPDVAEAERKMAAANARIGVAKAAFFPAIALTGDAGYSSFHASSLLDWQSQLYQIGPGVSFPVFTGGRLKAGLSQARADYQAACASYQQQVLVAFKDVSDSLTDLNSYDQQANSSSNTVNAAGEMLSISRQRYQQGLINNLEVLAAERNQLQARLQMTQIQAAHLIAAVHLIKALGGGFTSRDLTNHVAPAASSLEISHRPAPPFPSDSPD